MSKFFRRQFWYFSAFFSRYYLIILLSVLGAIVTILALKPVIVKIVSKKPTYRLGVVGTFTPQLLPTIAKNILNSSLFTIASNGEAVPNLAQELSISADGKVYQVKIKPGLMWSDGTPFNAQDVVLNIANVKVEAIDGLTLQFTLPEKFAPFPTLLNNPLINKQGLTISNYQIKLTQSSNGQLTQILMTNPQHQISIKTYPASATAITAYKLGEIDYLFNIDSPQPELDQYGQLAQVDNNHEAVALFFNHDDPILKDKFFRQALAYGLSDKTFGYSRALGPIAQTSWGYTPLVKSYDFDQPKAKKIVKDAAGPNPLPTLELAVNPQLLKYAENIKTQLEGLGLTINLKVATNKPEAFQMYLTYFEIPADPDQYVFWHSTQLNTNISHVKEERLDKTLEDARRLEVQADRKQSYFDFQRVFTEELPALFLFYPKYNFLSRHQDLFQIIPQSQVF